MTRGCGTRRAYQQGCRCFRCRKAEADYRRGLRYQLCRGRLPLGARVDARATHRLIRELVKKGYLRRQIAQFLGLKRPILEVHPTRVEYQTVLRVQRVHKAALAEGPELSV